MSEETGEEYKGFVVVTINQEDNISIRTSGIMEAPHFLSMASDYLERFKNKRWEEEWDSKKGEGE